MKLILKKPLVIFDLETTGLDILSDRITQISFVKVLPDGTEERYNYLVNPEREIPQDIVELTGITNEMLKDKPTFKDIAMELKQRLDGCDFAGFNSNRFDIPMLAEEFARAGVGFNFGRASLIDVMNIYHKLERRDLAAAYKFYTGREMDEDLTHHSADSDAEATYKVLMAQLDHYSAENESKEERILKNDISFLADFSKFGDNVDFAGRFVYKENYIGEKEVYVNFGKHKDKRLSEVFQRDPHFYSWVMNGQFSHDTKQTLTRLYLKEKSKR